MRRNLGAIQSTRKYSKYWIIYILFLISVVLINCILSLYSLGGVPLTIQIFTVSAFLTSPIYLIESFFTRIKYVKFFSEIKCINSILKPSTREHVLQLSKEDVVKIILVVLLFAVQLAIISVKCFLLKTFDLNV